MNLEIVALFLYLALILGVAVASWRKNLSSKDFILGDRKLGFWLTALAAHASDMSSWIFMGYPVVIFSSGFFPIWVGIGLTLFMYLNWRLVAPKIRKATEGYDSLTLSSFFESKVGDSSGTIRLLSAILSFIFYAVYISAGLVSLGFLLVSLFSISYPMALLTGLFLVVPYLFISGYLTLAWTDLVQGIFLLAVILAVPLILFFEIGGMSAFESALKARELSSFLPSLSFAGITSVLFAASSWGLGYFGQPHILTKFMGIQNPEEMPKSRRIGISWQILALTGATFIGLFSMAALPFPQDQLLFITLVRNLFSPFFSTLMICAILGVTLTTMGSYLLVVASSITEDLYKKIYHKDAASAELLWVSRLSIAGVAIIATVIALFRPASIFTLVEYAWFGLGSSFGPLTLFCLYAKRVTKSAAIAGLLTGGIVAATFPIFNHALGLSIPPLIPAFTLSALAIFILSKWSEYELKKDSSY